jgi:hypothetical protein
MMLFLPMVACPASRTDLKPLMRFQRLIRACGAISNDRTFHTRFDRAVAPRAMRCPQALSRRFLTLDAGSSHSPSRIRSLIVSLSRPSDGQHAA